MLDPVHPSHLQSSFDQVVAILRERGGMKEFERLGGRALIALDGTEYFCSQKLGCPHGQTRKRSNGKTDFYHSMLAATPVAPGHNMVVPLMPEFIARQDGAEKQDCERNAAKRWLAAHAARVKELRPVYLGDDLFACQPICEAVLSSGADFLFTAKPESHKTLYNFMNGTAIDEVSVTRKEGGKKLAYRYRWFSKAPLRDGKPALDVNWIGVTITTPRAKRPTTAPSSLRSRSRAKTSLRSRLAPGRAGKSRTKASTSSKTTAIISNITSATASRTSPCCSPP
jgi:hypothetical protein